LETFVRLLQVQHEEDATGLSLDFDSKSVARITSSCKIRGISNARVTSMCQMTASIDLKSGEERTVTRGTADVPFSLSPHAALDCAAVVWRCRVVAKFSREAASRRDGIKPAN
jgi:hypothetical protein